MAKSVASAMVSAPKKILRKPSLSRSSNKKPSSEPEKEYVRIAPDEPRTSLDGGKLEDAVDVLSPEAAAPPKPEVPVEDEPALSEPAPMAAAATPKEPIVESPAAVVTEPAALVEPPVEPTVPKEAVAAVPSAATPAADPELTPIAVDTSRPSRGSPAAEPSARVTPDLTHDDGAPRYACFLNNGDEHVKICPQRYSRWLKLHDDLPVSLRKLVKQPFPGKRIHLNLCGLDTTPFGSMNEAMAEERATALAKWATELFAISGVMETSAVVAFLSDQP